jgi:hypothetical protein
MAYYQNSFYPNYSSYMQQQQIPQYAAMTPQQTIQAIGLQGKVVDSIDAAKVSDVPFGGYALFPKADLSEIYIKSWNNNGTTQISVYKPIPAEDSPEQKQEDFNTIILQKVVGVEQKIDAIIGAINESPQPKKEKIEEKKDVSVNAY